HSSSLWHSREARTGLAPAYAAWRGTDSRPNCIPARDHAQNVGRTLAGLPLLRSDSLQRRNSCYSQSLYTTMKGSGMPKLTVEGFGTFDVPAGKRLVLALED